MRWARSDPLRLYDCLMKADMRFKQQCWVHIHSRSASKEHYLSVPKGVYWTVQLHPHYSMVQCQVYCILSLVQIHVQPKYSEALTDNKMWQAALNIS